MIKINDKKKISYLFCFIIIFFAGLLIFKNVIFYSLEDIYITDYTMDNMISYFYDDSTNMFSPNDVDARFELHENFGVVNNINIEYSKGLFENCTIYLYNILEDGTENEIEKKEVRKGYKKVDFSFASIELKGIKIVAKSIDGSRIVNLPAAKVVIGNKKINLLQRNTKYIVNILLIFCISILISFLISKNDDSKYLNKRDTNLELLRVVSMIFLVAHHYAVHGGLVEQPFSKTKYLGLCFLPIGKICFIAFIALSMYFLVDGVNKADRFLKCWLEVLFYSVLFTVVTWSMGGAVNVKDFVSSFFVMIGNSHGFAASYLLFLLVYPFILKATKNCNKKQCVYLVCITFWIQIMSQIMKCISSYNQPVYSELTLFVFCYFLSMYLKRYQIEILNKKLFDLLIVALIWVYVFVIYVVDYSGACNGITRFLRDITNDESSLIYIIGGYSMFYLFKNIKIPYNVIINKIASCCFGVLLIHDHNFFRHIFWNDIVKTQMHFNTTNIVLAFIAEVSLVFFTCAVIDYIRQKLLEKKILRMKWYKKFAMCLEEVLSDERK